MLKAWSVRVYLSCCNCHNTIDFDLLVPNQTPILMLSMTNKLSLSHNDFLNYMWWYCLRYEVKYIFRSTTWHAIRCYFSLILVAWHNQPSAHCFCKCNGFCFYVCCLNFSAGNSIFQIYHLKNIFRRFVQKCWPIRWPSRMSLFFQINDGKRWKNPGGIPHRKLMKNTLKNTSNEIHSTHFLFICKKGQL